MTPVRLPRIALRTALAASIISAGVMVATQQTGAQSLAQSFGNHDSNAPVDFEADKIEVQDREDRVILTGNVVIRQADLRLQAARTVVNFTNVDKLQVQRITASGGVRVTRGDEVATGDVAVYDFDKRIITMVGNASLKRGTSDTLRGGRFVVDLKTHNSSVSGGRVSGTFSVAKPKD